MAVNSNHILWVTVVIVLRAKQLKVIKVVVITSQRKLYIKT